MERCRRPVEGHAGCAREIGPEDRNGTSHLAEGGKHFHERSQSEGQLENGPLTVAAQQFGDSIEVPIGGLHQASREVAGWKRGRATTEAAEIGQRGELATRRDSVNRTSIIRTTLDRRPIQIAIRGPHQGPARSAVPATLKRVHRGQRTGGRDLENRSASVVSSPV